jgi:hypothetical protein
MGLTPRHALALMLPIVVAASSPVFAQEQPPTAGDRAPGSNAGTTLPSSPSKPRTGKERLGEKWMDEQRIDNCNVLLDRRGPKLRPDTCPNVPTE